MIQKLKEINHLVTAFWRNEEGATAIEYALIASAVGLALALYLSKVGRHCERSRKPGIEVGAGAAFERL